MAQCTCFIWSKWKASMTPADKEPRVVCFVCLSYGVDCVSLMRGGVMGIDAWLDQASAYRRPISPRNLGVYWLAAMQVTVFRYSQATSVGRVWSLLLSKYPHHARILVIGAECMQERGSSRCRERVRRLGQLPLDLGMFARVRYLTTIG